MKTYLGPQESFAFLKSSCPSTASWSSPPQSSQLWYWRERDRQDPEPKQRFTKQWPWLQQPLAKQPQEPSQRHPKLPTRCSSRTQEAFWCATDHSALPNAWESRSTNKKGTKWNNGAFLLTSALSKIPPLLTDLSGERFKDQQPAAEKAQVPPAWARGGAEESSCLGKGLLYPAPGAKPRGDPSQLHIPHGSDRRSHFYTSDSGEHPLRVFHKKLALFHILGAGLNIDTEKCFPFMHPSELNVCWPGESSRCRVWQNSFWF